MGSISVPVAVPLPGITDCLAGGFSINCSTSSNFASLQCSTQGSAANEKPLFEFPWQWGNPDSESVRDGVSSTHLSMNPQKSEEKPKGRESGSKGCNQESRSLRLVIRFSPKSKKYSIESKEEEQKAGAFGAEELEKESTGSEFGKKEGNRETRSSRKICIRLPSKEKKILSEAIRGQEEPKIENCDFHQEDEKPLSALKDHEESLPKIEEKQKKRGFTMALSKEQIEEDIIALNIGSKPSSRPKKRSRTVKQQLNHLFPGAWLESIAADDY